MWNGRSMSHDSSTASRIRISRLTTATTSHKGISSAHRKGDVDADDQDLVGQRVEIGAKLACPLEALGEIAVDGVADSCQEKHEERGPRVAVDKQPEDHGNGHDPRQSDEIRYIAVHGRSVACVDLRDDGSRLRTADTPRLAIRSVEALTGEIYRKDKHPVPAVAAQIEALPRKLLRQAAGLPQHSAASRARRARKAPPRRAPPHPASRSSLRLISCHSAMPRNSTAISKFVSAGRGGHDRASRIDGFPASFERAQGDDGRKLPCVGRISGVDAVLAPEDEGARPRPCRQG